MLMKRQMEKAHAKATPLDKGWTIIEYLEHEAKDYITNKSEAERDTDEKVFALLARRFGTGSSKKHNQQQYRTRKQNSEEDYMQYLDALEGLRSQGYPNEEVTVRRYEIMQRFIEGVCNFELKRNLALVYAPVQYVEAPPTVEHSASLSNNTCACAVLHVRTTIRWSLLNNNRPTTHNRITLRQRPHRPKKCSNSRHHSLPPTSNHFNRQQPTDSNPKGRVSTAVIRHALSGELL